MDDLGRQRSLEAAPSAGRGSGLDNAALGRITCPQCRTITTEAMPADQCLYFYECPGCRSLLRPRAGDCCVFCSYGDRPCPPKAGGCCA